MQYAAHGVCLARVTALQDEPFAKLSFRHRKRSESFVLRVRFFIFRYQNAGA
jgi:hypothetical protein